jgi:capping protein beta
VTAGSQSSGEWDSIHVFEATDRARMSHYKLTSTVILHLANETDALGEMDLSGNMTRQVEADLPVESDASHIANVGRLVEDMELKMRNLLRMCFPNNLPSTRSRTIRNHTSAREHLRSTLEIIC